MISVVCFSHLRWKFVFQRPQHLMVRFAQTHRVFFVEEPLPLDGEGAPFLQTTIDPDSGVWIVPPRCSTTNAEHAEAAVKVLLDSLLREHGIDRPILWYYTPMMRPLSAHIPARAIVYDCMDELANFKFAPASLIAREKQLFAGADVVFTGGESLYERKKGQHLNVHCFPSHAPWAFPCSASASIRLWTIRRGWMDDRAALGLFSASTINVVRVRIWRTRSGPPSRITSIVRRLGTWKRGCGSCPDPDGRAKW